ncbi:hypothetical protein VMCG_08813 [Cytospora schulzeri]|uniref:Uncharacterized protein n=1 Tax=Cytospora schulzeri TaxID=448051 RepID=A0A423VSA1_9PEZI|nr:hypothetical protein VMCG_08813 [Valsa malicola]
MSEEEGYKMEREGNGDAKYVLCTMAVGVSTDGDRRCQASRVYRRRRLGDAVVFKIDRELLQLSGEAPNEETGPFDGM